jgi:Aspartate oxidase
MRGEGAQLRNNKGALFMQRYHPMGALAPRDIVSRAILAEMAATKARHVYLDVTHLGAEFIGSVSRPFMRLAFVLISISRRNGSRVSQRALYDGRGLD